jgi:hypothetical protein
MLYPILGLMLFSTFVEISKKCPKNLVFPRLTLLIF